MFTKTESRNNPAFFQLRPIDNLVLEGGGVKGFYHVGALLALEKYEMLSKLKRVAGSSIGSLIALSIALDYSAEEIKEIIIHQNFFDFIDGTGQYIKKLCNMLINSKLTGYSYLTFKELNDLSLESNQYKSLYVTGVNLLEWKLEIFSHETTPHMSIAKAIQISMALPGLFCPVEHEGKLFVDGGAFSNLPLFIFDDAKYLAGGKLNSSRINMRTLGIALSVPERTVWERGDYTHSKKPPACFFLKNNLVPFSSQYHFHHNHFNSLRILYLTTHVCALNFWVTKEKKQKEINRAEQETINYLQTYFVDAHDPHESKKIFALRAKL